MSQRLTVLLSDDEYARLAHEAANSGSTIEAIAHYRLIHSSATLQTPDDQTITEYLHQRGVIANRPSGESDSPEEEAEAHTLSQLLGGGKSAAELVIEDRGPF